LDVGGENMQREWLEGEWGEQERARQRWWGEDGKSKQSLGVGDDVFLAGVLGVRCHGNIMRFG
jgi:hypothetical protein